MTEQEIKELAQTAAHSVTIVTDSNISAYMPKAVDVFLMLMNMR